MHILYVDDSGSPENSQERYFVLGGLCVFERGIHHQIVAIDRCVADFNLGEAQDIELHGSPMYSGRSGVWARVRQRERREEMIRQALSVCQPASSVRLFAVAIDKLTAGAEDPVEIAFEELCNRFNLFLQRTNNRLPGESNRGLIIMDETKHQKPLQSLARHFRTNGGRWGRFRNLVEAPLFVDSRASRLVQMADLVAYATWRRYEFSDGRFFDPLIPKFDSDGGIIHGLVHRNRGSECFCPACYSRRWGMRLQS